MMKRVLMVVSVGASLLVITSLVAGQEKKSNAGVLTGAWECVAHGSVQGDVPFTLKMEQNGETVTGSVATDNGELEITSATYKDDTLEIHLEADSMKYEIKGRLQGERLQGQWSKEGGEEGPQGGAWEGQRAKGNQAQ